MTKNGELTVNTLGAFADELSFAMDKAVSAATGLRGEASAALTALLNSPGLSIKQLSRHLDMASPSAVQLVSRLEADRLLTRRPGPDARTRALVLTAAGRRTATRVLQARRAVISRRLDELSGRQRSELHGVLITLLGSLRGLDVDLDHLCRRCDESVCAPEVCPVDATSGIGTP
jgi:DNA-binding MarR family transcriptional regulator